jgi:hypothetical protein
MRRMRKPSLVVTFVLLCAAVPIVAGCGPSIDAAAKADIDRRSGALGQPAQTIPAPSGFLPQPLRVGQWTQHRLLDENQQPSFLTYKVVGQDGDAFWMEALTESYTGRMVTKILLAIPDRMDPASIDIRALSMKDKNGHVTTIDGPMLQMMRGLYKNAVSMLIISWQGQPQEDAAVPAGQFTGCFKMRTDAQWGPWKSANTSWSHPEVPISGLVRSQGIDKPTSMELVAFGQTGAVSDF